MSEKKEPAVTKSKRAPLWLRVVLMILLVLFAALAFYLNNLNIIERLNQ